MEDWGSSCLRNRILDCAIKSMEKKKCAQASYANRYPAQPISLYYHMYLFEKRRFTLQTNSKSSVSYIFQQLDAILIRLCQKQHELCIMLKVSVPKRK